MRNALRVAVLFAVRLFEMQLEDNSGYWLFEDGTRITW